MPRAVAAAAMPLFDCSTTNRRGGKPSTPGAYSVKYSRYLHCALLAPKKPREAVVGDVGGIGGAGKIALQVIVGFSTNTGDSPGREKAMQQAENSDMGE
jgi:hypothetical protein